MGKLSFVLFYAQNKEAGLILAIMKEEHHDCFHDFTCSFFFFFCIYPTLSLSLDVVMFFFSNKAIILHFNSSLLFFEHLEIYMAVHSPNYKMERLYRKNLTSRPASREEIAYHCILQSVVQSSCPSRSVY